MTIHSDLLETFEFVQRLRENKHLSAEEKSAIAREALGLLPADMLSGPFKRTRDILTKHINDLIIPDRSIITDEPVSDPRNRNTEAPKEAANVKTETVKKADQGSSPARKQKR